VFIRGEVFPITAITCDDGDLGDSMVTAPPKCGLITKTKTTPSGLAQNERFETKLSKRGTKRFGAHIRCYPDRKA